MIRLINREKNDCLKKQLLKVQKISERIFVEAVYKKTYTFKKDPKAPFRWGAPAIA